MKMFQDDEGVVDDSIFNMSYLSIGVPRTVAGLLNTHDQFGKLSRREVLAPSLKLAEEGFPVSYDLSRLLRKYEDRLRKCEASTKVFFKGKIIIYQVTP